MSDFLSPDPDQHDADDAPRAPLSERVSVAAANPFAAMDSQLGLDLGGDTTSQAAYTPQGASSAFGEPAPTVAPRQQEAPQMMPPPEDTEILDPVASLRQRGEARLSTGKRSWVKRAGGLAVGLGLLFGATQLWNGKPADSGQGDRGYFAAAPAAHAQGYLPFYQIGHAAYRFSDAGKGDMAGQPVALQLGAQEGTDVLMASMLANVTDPEAKVAMYVVAMQSASLHQSKDRMTKLIALSSTWEASLQQDWRTQLGVELGWNSLSEMAIASGDAASAGRFTRRAEAAGIVAKGNVRTAKGSGWTSETLGQMVAAVNAARNNMPEGQPEMFEQGYKGAIDQSVLRIRTLAGMELEDGRADERITATALARGVTERAAGRGMPR